MKRLTCEMCGSADLVKDGGVFACQSCGCKYSVAEAKKMMVEEPVQVEGHDQVGGSDQVDIKAQIDSMCRNARRLYEEGKNPECRTICAELLKLDPGNHYGIIYGTLLENVELANNDVCWDFESVETSIAGTFETAAKQMSRAEYFSFCEDACRDYGALVRCNVGHAKALQTTISEKLLVKAMDIAIAKSRSSSGDAAGGAAEKAQLEQELEAAGKRAGVSPEEREARLLSLGFGASAGVDGEIDAGFLAYAEFLANYNASLSELVDGVERFRDEDAWLERNYQAACNLERECQSSPTGRGLAQAIALFGKIGDYKDAQARREFLERAKLEADEEASRATAFAEEGKEEEIDKSEPGEVKPRDSQTLAGDSSEPSDGIEDGQDVCSDVNGGTSKVEAAASQQSKGKSNIAVGVLLAAFVIGVAIALASVFGAPALNPAESPFVGTWVLEDVSGVSALNAETLKREHSYGRLRTMTLNEDGTVSLKGLIINDDTGETAFRWRPVSSDTAHFTNLYATLELKGEQLVMTSEASVITFTFIRYDEEQATLSSSSSSRLTTGLRNNSYSASSPKPSASSKSNSSGDSISYRGGNYEYLFTDENGESTYYDKETKDVIYVDKDGNKEWTDGYGNHHPAE